MMKRTTRRLAFLLTLVLSFAAQADEPVPSVGELRFVMDTVAFRGPGQGAWVEVYTHLEATQLDFKYDRGRPLAKIRMTMTVVDSTLRTYKKRTWIRKLTTKEDKDYYESIPFRDITAIDLPPGLYGLSLTVEDANTGIRGTTARLIEVEPLGEDLAMSDLLFAKEIKKGDEGRFDKGAWKVIPNVDRHYAIGDPMKVYFEIYNLREGLGEEAGLVLGYRLLYLDGRVVHQFDDSRVRKPGHRAAKVADFQTAGLSRGRYILEVEAFDRASQAYRTMRRLVKIGTGSVTVTRRPAVGGRAG
tara:strand:- start:88 stop:990 length:903 start_codon:yes stop_codon:yes gene_type:complete